MVSHIKGNPSERIILAEDVQRGFNESGKTPDDWIKRFVIARLRASINVPQNCKNTITTFLWSRRAITSGYATTKKWSRSRFFWGSL
jgi:hypothetical protein